MSIWEPIHAQKLITTHCTAALHWKIKPAQLGENGVGAAKEAGSGDTKQLGNESKALIAWNNYEALLKLVNAFNETLAGVAVWWLTDLWIWKRLKPESYDDLKWLFKLRINQNEIQK